MRLTNIKLRGAIGIKKGLGLDEISIDLTKFGPGLIALTGKNGSGKTTLLEQMHFYRTTVSHDGLLQSQFFLKDSYRIVEGIHRGIKYEGNIKIDALTDGCEAYLFQVNADGSKIPLNDGLRGTYDEALEKVMGTEELFFNSAFAGQKAKGIANLKTVERRKLFYEILSLTSYEAKCEIAKKQLAIAENKLADIEGQIKALTSDPNEIIELQKSLEDYAAQIEIGNHDIELFESSIKTTRENIKNLEISIANGNNAISTNGEIANKITTLENQIKTDTNAHNSKINRLNGEISDYNKLIERSQRIINNKEKIGYALTSKEALQKQHKEYTESKMRANQEYSEFQKNYTEELKKLSTSESNIAKLRSALQLTKSEFNETARTIERNKIQVKTIDTVPCTAEIGAGCRFLADAYKSKEEISELQDKLDNLNKILNEKGLLLETSEKEYLIEKQLLDEKYQLTYSKSKSNIDAIDKFLRDIDAEIKEIDKGKWEELNKELATAENEIASLNIKIEHSKETRDNAIADFNAMLTKIQVEIEELRGKIDNDIECKIIELKRDLQGFELQLKCHESELTRSTRAVEALKNQQLQTTYKIETLNNNVVIVNKLNEDKAAISIDIKEWAFLVRANDKTGIPVLKMENAGSSITSIANELLNFYNEQSRIKIETTKLSKDKKKVIESFDIIAIDKHGIPGISATMDIKDKSGGEKVWYQSALQGAISIFKNQDAEELTVFFDEQDGPLDSYGAVERYFEMLSKVHVKTNAYQTILITHRPEIIDMIPQQIKLGNGQLQIIN